MSDMTRMGCRFVPLLALAGMGCNGLLGFDDGELAGWIDERSGVLVEADADSKGVVGQGSQQAAEAVALVVGLQKNFFYLGLFCVFLVMATGAGRSFTYVGNVYGEDAEKVRRRMLLVKHVVLFVLFGLGTWWQYSLVFS